VSAWCNLNEASGPGLLASPTRTPLNPHCAFRVSCGGTGSVLWSPCQKSRSSALRWRFVDLIEWLLPLPTWYSMPWQHLLVARAEWLVAATPWQSMAPLAAVSWEWQVAVLWMERLAPAAPWSSMARAGRAAAVLRRWLLVSRAAGGLLRTAPSHNVAPAAVESWQLVSWLLGWNLALLAWMEGLLALVLVARLCHQRLVEWTVIMYICTGLVVPCLSGNGETWPSRHCGCRHQRLGAEYCMLLWYCACIVRHLLLWYRGKGMWSSLWGVGAWSTPQLGNVSAAHAANMICGMKTDAIIRKTRTGKLGMKLCPCRKAIRPASPSLRTSTQYMDLATLRLSQTCFQTAFAQCKRRLMVKIHD
jgi:hypothetical protein